MSKKVSVKKFRKVLVANRGEIAIRIFRALSELGITTVSIYSKEDRYAMFRSKADESYPLNPQKGPIDAYLDIDTIIKIALSTGVDAIHPGYGFLSENPDFADACERNGIVFIGPGSNIMNAMGDKISSKKIAIEANVPIIPGVDYAIKEVDEAKKIAAQVGYPVMLKASNGGGGRGMRIVNQEETEESAEQTEERTEAEASGAVSAEKPKKGRWRERLIANAQMVEYGDKAAEIVDFAIIDHKGMITSSVDKNQRFRIKMKIKFHETMEHPIFAFSIKDRKGTEITGTNTALEDYTKDVVEAGKTVTVCFDQIMPLQSGQYLMSFGCTSYHLEELVIHHRLYDACFLEVFSMKDTVGFFDMNSTVTYE